MKLIYTDTINGRVSVPVYHYSEIPYTDIMLSAPESKKRRGESFLEIPCAFDIETTNIYKRKGGRIDTDAFIPYAFMYHWQFCIGYRVVFGRTWGDFRKMLRMIEKNMNLSKNLKLVVYVHNLSFEMQFMRKFLNVTDSFCKEDRAPLKIVHNHCIEFRCSAALSNMNLQMFCKNEGAKFYKLVDEYDYNKIRTSETELTETEQSYCYNDVRGLCECIQSLMRFDTLATMPLTNTGYVRRDSRNQMRKNKKNRKAFTDTALSPDEYKYFRRAFRGGDTHANIRYSAHIVKNVTSYDISSSYPACMMINKFPVSKFIWITLETLERTRREEKGRFCYLLHVYFRDIVCTAEHGIPYIPLAKTKDISNDRILDNGRIRRASGLIMWLTDIDLDIIQSEYSYSEMRIEAAYMAFAGDLPPEYKAVIMDYYEKKTTLKGLSDDESLYMYAKSKNRLKSLYGMMAMRIDRELVRYTGNGQTGYEPEEKDFDETIEKYYRSRNNFLPYQWGVWVTAWARFRLHEMMQMIGRDLIYVDTDSVKFRHKEKHLGDIKTLNKRLQMEAEASGAFADDRKGIRHYMGVWEHDGDYDRFKTLGAKKYVVDIGGRCYSTIAGVSKKAGQRFFEKKGLEAFKIGAVIPQSGHLVAFYNDDEIHTIEVDGVKMETASNVALIDDTYTIGVTSDYLALMNEIKYS